MSIFNRKAEAFIREETALYRHYDIREVQGITAQFTGVELSDEEAIALVQRIRDEQGMGPISDANLPGHDNDEKSGFFRWFRR